MAFAVAAQVSRSDGSCTGDTELTSAASAAQYLTDRCLTDAPLGRVGLEVEAHCYDPADPCRRPGWEEIGDVLRSLPALPGGSVVTVEPGGA
ncbi:MAG: ergothioneine biosynthesis glutamate--cysteine ligase EgtA, partial [Mycobacterium sp.]